MKKKVNLEEEEEKSVIKISFKFKKNKFLEIIIHERIIFGYF